MAQLYLSASLRLTGFACKGPSADRYLNSTASARHKCVGWGARGLSGFTGVASQNSNRMLTTPGIGRSKSATGRVGDPMFPISHMWRKIAEGGVGGLRRRAGETRRADAVASVPKAWRWLSMCATWWAS